ncbi:MAG: FAD-binding oxidoreductase [Candidatus Micrarchaeota archaeon]|nr:FAD-binding oxidoreductase [Candidatus Micrarchaeota archaeon]
MEFKPYRIVEIVNEAQDVRTFKILPVKGELPSYQPGHFFLLQLPDGTGKTTHRPYSAASHPDQKELWFCVKNKGFFPSLLWKLNVGDLIGLDGPYGLFLLSKDDKKRVFIGGGVGISALRSMILQTIKENMPCWLFHSAHTKEGLVYFDEMQKLSAQHQNFVFFPSISGEEAPPGWQGLKGRISLQSLLDKLGTLEGMSFYLCGSKEMVGALASSLASAGVPKERIKKDEWG